MEFSKYHTYKTKKSGEHISPFLKSLNICHKFVYVKIYRFCKERLLVNQYCRSCVQVVYAKNIFANISDSFVKLKLQTRFVSYIKKKRKKLFLQPLSLRYKKCIVYFWSDRLKQIYD